eukprot:GGOE01019554.1.p1 GENE.GGOE01019554.1~~GGOE01019554.1.p1  ORF type:complete len:323 (+),score=93.56 GGOE01019554.1:136-1104(+)
MGVFVYTEHQRKQDAFVAGFVSGMISIVGTFWLDVKKVQRQVQGQQFRLWKGIAPAMASQAFRTGITYCGFDTLGLHFRAAGLTGFGWEFLAAALGAVVGEVIATPMDVWKNMAIKHQMMSTARVPGWIWRTNGLLGFFRGIAPAALRKSLSNGGMLSTAPYVIQHTYDGLCWVHPEGRGSRSVKTASKLLGGGIAGGTMEVLTLPIDKCRVYTQAMVDPATGHTYSTLQAMRVLWAGGVLSWFAGAVPAFVRKGLIKAVQYFVLLEAVALLKGRAVAQWREEVALEEEQRHRASIAAAKAAAESAAQKHVHLKHPIIVDDL